jgi:hypothetical protein
VFVSREQGRPLAALPAEGRVSVMTVAELRIGVLVASDPAVRAQRMRTLTEVEALFVTTENGSQPASAPLVVEG